jgi:hypothetical protein
VAPLVGVAATPSGKGYWEVASDGGVFAFGDAPFKGSKGGQPLKDPVSGITGTPSGQGYLLTAADGGVFAYGDAAFKGSMGTRPLAASVNSIVRTPSGGGYWLSAVDGGVFAFGDASYLGRATYNPPAVPSGGTAAQRAAGLAHGWVGLDYQGVNKDYWNAPKHPELWCADFLTYTWQHAGINIPHYSAVSSLQSWAQKTGAGPPTSPIRTSATPSSTAARTRTSSSRSPRTGPWSASTVTGVGRAATTPRSPRPPG